MKKSINIQIVKQEDTILFFLANGIPFLMEVTNEVVNDFWYNDYNNSRAGDYNSACEFIDESDIKFHAKAIIENYQEEWQKPEVEELERVFGILYKDEYELAFDSTGMNILTLIGQSPYITTFCSAIKKFKGEKDAFQKACYATKLAVIATIAQPKANTTMEAFSR